MDNAAKAIILAGGILISAMVVSIAIYILTNARGFAETSDDQARLVAVQSFNNFYTSFGSTINGADLLNIYNKAIDDKKNGHEISVTGQVSIDDVSSLGEMVEALTAPTGAEYLNETFTYTIEKYDPDGYITEVKITK